MTILFSLLLGLIIGSFLNVVIYRLPIMIRKDWQEESYIIASEFLQDPREKDSLRNKMVSDNGIYNLALPSSHCPFCHARISYRHNIPIVGFLLLGGKCKDCQNKISIRYPMVEFLSALATCLCFYEFSWSLTGASLVLLSCILICLACIDYESGLLPDSITIPFIWVGLMLNYFDSITPFEQAFWGAFFGYIILWAVYQGFKLLTNKEGMGYGDFKMLAMLGAWLGIFSIPAIIMISSISCLIAVGLLWTRGRDLSEPIRFGPFLAFASFAVIFWGEEINNFYFNSLSL